MKKLLMTIAIVLIICVLLVLIIKGGDTVKIKVADGTLYGDLIDCGKEVVVLIVAGSGPTDMDGNTSLMQGRNDSFLQLARALKKENISSFRYDKRSAGKSAETFDPAQQVYFDNFVEDCGACITYLKEQGFKKIVITGHSQGSLISLILANNDDIDGVISIAGAGSPIGETMVKQFTAQLGEDASQIKTLKKLMAGELDYEVDENDPFFSMPKQKFLLSWMAYDPVEVIMQANRPVLIIQGKADLQTGVEDYNALIEAQPKASGVLIDDMNHVLKDVTNNDDNIKSYQDPSFALHHELVETMVKFVQDKVMGIE